MGSLKSKRFIYIAVYMLSKFDGLMMNLMIFLLDVIHTIFLIVLT